MSKKKKKTDKTNRICPKTITKRLREAGGEQGLVCLDVVVWEGAEPICLPHMMAVVEGRHPQFDSLPAAISWACTSGFYPNPTPPLFSPALSSPLSLLVSQFRLSLFSPCSSLHCLPTLPERLGCLFITAIVLSLAPPTRPAMSSHRSPPSQARPSPALPSPTPYHFFAQPQMIVKPLPRGKSAHRPSPSPNPSPSLSALHCRYVQPSLAVLPVLDTIFPALSALHCLFCTGWQLSFTFGPVLLVLDAILPSLSALQCRYCFVLLCTGCHYSLRYLSSPFSLLQHSLPCVLLPFAFYPQL